MIRREDGSWLYMLPSAVDDIEMGVTHVVRGEDHVTNTGLQIQMFEALGATPPAFAHAALLVGSEGKLSKRLGSLGVETMREQGIEPMALVAKLARIGTSAPVEPFATPEPLIASFDFHAFGRAPARFDMDELTGLNARIVHQLGFDQVADRLPAGMTEEGWAAIRPNLASVAEAADWWHIVEGPVDASLGARRPRLLRRRRRDRGRLDWEAAPWPALTAELKARTGRAGKALVPPAAPRADRARQRPRNGPAAAT